MKDLKRMFILILIGLVVLPLLTKTLLGLSDTQEKYYTGRVGVKTGLLIDFEKGEGTPIEGSSIEEKYEVLRESPIFELFYRYLHKKGGLFEITIGGGFIYTGSYSYKYTNPSTGVHSWTLYHIKNKMLFLDILGGYKYVYVGAQLIFRGTPVFKETVTGIKVEDEKYSDTDAIVYLGFGSEQDIIKGYSKVRGIWRIKLGYGLTPGYSAISKVDWQGFMLGIEIGLGIGIF